MKSKLFPSFLFLFVLIVSGIGFFSSSESFFSISKSESSPKTELPTVSPVENEFGVPINIRIPKIDVDVKVEQVGVTKDDEMDMPSNPFYAGWFKLGYRPGELGNAVIAGHYDTDSGERSIFYRLDELLKGDKIYTTDDKGKRLEWTVADIKIHPEDEFPIDEVFGSWNFPRLSLITCYGVYKNETYDKRLVVYSVLN